MDNDTRLLIPVDEYIRTDQARLEQAEWDGEDTLAEQLRERIGWIKEQYDVLVPLF